MPKPHFYADSKSEEEAICIKNQMFHLFPCMAEHFCFFLQGGSIYLCEDWKSGILEHSFFFVEINFFFPPKTLFIAL